MLSIIGFVVTIQHLSPKAEIDLFYPSPKGIKPISKLLPSGDGVNNLEMGSYSSVC